METSIIIRTKNEEKWLGAVLRMLQKQTYQDFEIIIVDSGSTDKTLEICEKFPTKIFHIKPENFTYPYALNFGCEKSNASKYIVFLSAHSLPISEKWLEYGISNFDKKNVMGVFGSMRALPDGGFWEKMYFNVWVAFLDCFSKRRTEYNEPGMGIMGFTHAIIRKDLWSRHNFDERYAGGGEDMAWSDFWFKKGYIAIKDNNFSVYHSHGLGFIAFLKQWKYWISVKNPQPYKPLKYRIKK